MDYISTRGKAKTLTFKEALLAGLAEDGGLYVPKSLPVFSADEIRSFQGKPYSEIALEIIKVFVDGEIDEPTLHSMIDEAYGAFDHLAVAPLQQIGPNDWLLELFYGPTLAFKDFAMQILARLMDHILTEQGRRLTIVGATSGDTGGAALEAFKDCSTIDTFFMFPNGKVSDVQRQQMTTIGAKNAHPIAINGSFDVCQNMVKDMFADTDFARTVHLSAVNSINWGRIMAQTVYYFTAAVALGGPDRSVSFTVPTGNFGDIYAGYLAKQMGLSIDRLVVASNENDVLSRVIQTGEYSLEDVKATITPSMDIQIPSNFERLLFDASGRDSDVVTNLMTSIRTKGRYTLPENVHSYITQFFSAGSTNQDQTRDMMKDVYQSLGYLVDPHTAVALHVAGQVKTDRSPMVTLATAHPSKFPQTVKEATGQFAQLPEWAAHRAQNPEFFAVIENDLKAVKDHIKHTFQTIGGR